MSIIPTPEQSIEHALMWLKLYRLENASLKEQIEALKKEKTEAENTVRVKLSNLANFEEALRFISAETKLSLKEAQLVAFNTLEHGHVTCLECKIRHVCRVAYDAYNTGGDCLAEK